MKKTILFVFYHPFNPAFGGIQRVTDLLAKSFIRQGYKVLYLNLLKNEQAMNYAFPCPVYFYPESEISSSANITFYHQFLQDHQVNVVINQAGTFSASNLFLNRGNHPAKTISVLHSTPSLGLKRFFSEILITKDNSFQEIIQLIKRILFYPSLKRRMWKRMKRHYRNIAGHSDIVCILSESLKTDLLQAGFTEMDKVRVIPNPNSFHIEGLEKNKQKELLYVGRLEKSEKQVPRLLKIWKKLYKDFPDWRFYIVGDGGERQNLEKYIKSHALERVFIEGLQSPEGYYKRASIFCLTSDYEGFPMVLTEAMQFGVVPVTFNSFGSATDIIVPGKTGLLIHPFDLDEYAENLRMLMRDDDKRERMAQEAFDFVQRFDIERITNQWITLMNE